jgi:hypothetical protein
VSGWLAEQAKAQRFAEIEARLVADDARRVSVLQTWGRLHHHLASRLQTAERAPGAPIA